MRLTPATAARARRRGLSLLEVILSLAILIIAMTGLGMLINAGSEHEMYARLTTTGTRLAQSKLAEVEAGIEALEAGNGTFDNDPGWSWEKKADDQGSNLWLVTVTVSRDYRGQQFQLSLGQYLIDPSVTGSASKQTRPSSTTSGSSP